MIALFYTDNLDATGLALALAAIAAAAALAPGSGLVATRVRRSRPRLLARHVMPSCGTWCPVAPALVSHLLLQPRFSAASTCVAGRARPQGAPSQNWPSRDSERRSRCSGMGDPAHPYGQLGATSCSHTGCWPPVGNTLAVAGQNLLAADPIDTKRLRIAFSSGPRRI